MASAALRPAVVVNGVKRVHSSDDMIAGEARDVLCAQMLSVFDAKATIAIAVFVFHLLVNRNDKVFRAIADGVNDHLQAGAIRASPARPHPPFRTHLIPRTTALAC